MRFPFAYFQKSSPCNYMYEEICLYLYEYILKKCNSVTAGLVISASLTQPVRNKVAKWNVNYILICMWQWWSYFESGIRILTLLWSDLLLIWGLYIQCLWQSSAHIRVYIPCCKAMGIKYCFFFFSFPFSLNKSWMIMICLLWLDKDLSISLTPI